MLAACAVAPGGEKVSGLLDVKVAPPPAALATPGFHHLTSATATLYVPPNLSAGHPAPFLLLLHGAGGRGDNMIRKFRDQADARGIVLLAPDSAGSTWDIATSVATNRSKAPEFGEDVARIDAALTEAFSQISVDPKHIAVGGISDGAGYALSLGARNSGLFRSIMAFSAGMMVTGPTGPPGRVFISHGTKDRVLPIELSRDLFAPALRNAGFSVTFVTFDGGHELPNDIMNRALDWWLN